MATIKDGAVTLCCFEQGLSVFQTLYPQTYLTILGMEEMGLL